MAQIDKCEGNMMRTQPISNLAVKADQEGTEFVNPSETALTDKPPLVDFRIEKTLATPLGLLPVALVLRHIRDKAMIETDLARIAGVKGGISIEKRAFEHDA